MEASKSSEYAMMNIIKGVDSPRQYVEDPDWAIKSANLLMENNEIRHTIENDYKLSVPL